MIDTLIDFARRWGDVTKLVAGVLGSTVAVKSMILPHLVDSFDAPHEVARFVSMRASNLCENGVMLIEYTVAKPPTDCTVSGRDATLTLTEILSNGDEGVTFPLTIDLVGDYPGRWDKPIKKSFHASLANIHPMQSVFPEYGTMVLRATIPLSSPTGKCKTLFYPELIIDYLKSDDNRCSQPGKYSYNKSAVYDDPDAVKWLAERHKEAGK